MNANVNMLPQKQSLTFQIFMVESARRSKCTLGNGLKMNMHNKLVSISNTTEVSYGTLIHVGTGAVP